MSRHSWPDEETIYVVEPWSCTAEAILSRNFLDTADPIIRSGKQYDYFIEGFIVREFIAEDLAVSTPDVGDEACERLIYYAINDA